MRKLMEQILKFGVVGGIAFVIDSVIYVALIEFVGIHYLVAGGISFTVSVVFNYILSITWVFEAKKDNNKKKEFTIFIILSVIGLGINQVALWIMIDKFPIALFFFEKLFAKKFLSEEFIAKIMATGIVMVYNFITRKIFIEKKETE